MTVDTSKLADDWIRYWQKPTFNENDPNAEAAAILDELVRDDPLHALRTMDKIVEKTTDQKILASLGAGPLQDLLSSDNGAQYAEEIIDRARQYKNWRFAFGCVWTGSFANREIALRVEKAINVFFPQGRP